MARFVEFQRRIAKTIWINPDCVVGVTEQGEGEVGIHGADGETPWIVPGTVAEVLAKLQGELRIDPAKAGDDITGWWVSDDRVIYVIGFRPDGRIAYLWDNGRCTTHDDVGSLESWTRDPNRKGWEE
jgi:hypothetical protein